MIKVLFFAQLREVLDCASLELEANVSNIAELRAQLAQKGQRWQEFLASDKALVAVNQTLVNEDCTLNSGDEVAFFPPVTGG
ncbi:molybdopterin synthase sulfur carrier subunit [Bowmanella sp. Y26]|uniref:molybdopterin synthase sulfur carrier subunit n=1 Tax=Bowmanella yangjiangensis TaxID=2811230 RepID=UPI001BDBEE3B|nr:molybdopterin synthase sulfur carrier subunit [Bowmanella yangjiangensis]MBT1065201.1 molybdopterin synthase sulfur carrier subunit [Bowmanella yangjiangensis]